MQVNNNQSLSFQGAIKVPLTKGTAQKVAKFESKFGKYVETQIDKNGSANFLFKQGISGGRGESLAVEFLRKLKLPYIHWWNPKMTKSQFSPLIDFVRFE